jgi:endoglucanase
MVLQHLAKLTNLTGSSLRAATGPGGGTLTINHAVEILGFLAKLSPNRIASHPNSYCNWCNTVTTTTTVATTAPPQGRTVSFANLTAQDLIGSMRAGWNLGNTFDFHRGPADPNAAINVLETSWLQANQATTRTLIQAVKAQGFDTIRVPVTWYKVADRNNNWAIRQEFMNRIKEVVGWILDENMFVILNTHHEEFHHNNPQRANWGGFSTRPADEEASKAFITRMWEQIAPEFATIGGTRNHMLIFEVLNEPRDIGSDMEWRGGTPAEREVLNRLNQVAVDTIRATGGNNANRILMIPTYVAGTQTDAFNGFTIPDDPANPGVNKLALSVHAYLPEPFCFRDNSPSVTNGIHEFNEFGQNMIVNMFNRVQQRAQTLGVPVVMGEWGSVNKNNTNDRARHAEFYVREASQRGVLTVWWDNGLGNLNRGSASTADGFGIIQRVAPHSTTWTVPAVGGTTYNFQPIIDAIMRSAGAPPARLQVTY